MEITPHQTMVLAAFAVGGFGAASGVQFQALMYLLAVIYGVQDFASFMVATFLFTVVSLYTNASRAARK